MKVVIVGLIEHTTSIIRSGCYFPKKRITLGTKKIGQLNEVVSGHQ